MKNYRIDPINIILLTFLLIIVSIIGVLLEQITFSSFIISISIIFIISKIRIFRFKNIPKIYARLKSIRIQRNIPNSKKEAAIESLKNIDLLIDKIHSSVAQRKLKEDKAQIQKELLRGNINIAVFGSGSSGKTSLIRALLKK